MKREELNLGIYEKALPADLDWPGRLALAEKLGFTFVEISIDESDRRLSRLEWSREERRDFLLAVEASPLYVPSACFSGQRKYPLGSRELEVRKKSAELLEKAIILAADTGIRNIQLAGYDVYYETGDEETRKWFIQGLSAGMEIAARYQVMLSMEIMDTPFMSSVVRFLNLKKELPGPWLTLYPDVGNLSAWGNDVEQELELGLPWITAIHLKDTLAVTPDFPGQFRDLPFGSGCVDFPLVFRTLAKLGYRGPFLIEMWSEKAEDPEAEICGARDWILQAMKAGQLLEQSG